MRLTKLRPPPRLAAAVILLSALGTVSVATADSSDNVPAAELLFDQGLADFHAGKTDQACQKFAESMRLDPANGTLLNLARCHERQGKTATAWVEFTDVAAAFARAGDKERATVASDSAARLDGLLPMLRVEVQHPVPNLTILRDGMVLPTTSWGQAMPVDPGPHRIRASAPGYVSATIDISVAPNGAHADAAIPALEREPGSRDQTPPRAHTPPERSFFDGRGLATAGVVFGSIGVGAAIAGGILGGISLVQLSDAREDPTLCPNEVCSPAGRAKVDGADQLGSASTALLGVGAALAATGIVMISVDVARGRSDEPGRTAKLSPLAVPAGAGAAVQIDF